MIEPKQFWPTLSTMLKEDERAVYIFDNRPDQEPNYAILVFKRDKHGLWHLDPEAINDYFMSSLERIGVVQKPIEALTFIKNKWA